MPVSPMGDMFADFECVEIGPCKFWGGDGICVASIELMIYENASRDMKRSFWRHLGSSLAFWRTKYYDDWFLSLWEHLKAKLGKWEPKDPEVYCILELKQEEEEEFYEEEEDPFLY